MIGIYRDEFLNYLKKKLGDDVKITNKNIITRCPYCELDKEKKHYHLYISLFTPIFHCFHATCEQSGFLNKLLGKIEGYDISENFIDKDKLKEYQQKQVFEEQKDIETRYKLPALKKEQFKLKELYIKKRFKFSNIPLTSVKGLLFDVHEFIKINQIPIDEKLFRLQDYLQSNFVGFLTENHSTLMFRNIDDSHDFRFYKHRLHYTPFIDYYKLNGFAPTSTKIILAEGIFDIFAEQIFDNLNLKSSTAFYASVLSSKYLALIQALAFYEQIFRPDIIILSDRGIPLSQYENLYHFNKHIINTLKVYYNKSGKDFNQMPITPEKFNIGRRQYNGGPNYRKTKRTF